MTKILLTMPQPGETITEGLVVKWLVAPGTTVFEGTPLVELETEKAVFEYESPFAGSLDRIVEGDGKRVKVGEPIAVFEVDADKARQYVRLGIAQPAHSGDELPASAAPIPIRPDSMAKNHDAALTQNAASKNQSGSVIRMSPYVRKRAQEAGLDLKVLADLAGGGDEARVTKEAIDRYLDGPGVAAVPVTKVGGAADFDGEVLPVSPVRMRIAENMVLSKSKIPHAHTGLSADVSKLVAFRSQHKNFGFLSLIFEALLSAIRAHPVINATYVDKGEKSEIRIFRKINLGVAIGTEHGLVIPVLRDVGMLDRNTFNAAVQDLIKRAHSKQLKPEEVGGATVIFNNFGYFGTGFGVQIIQYPLAATIGMGVIEKRVVPVGDEIGVREMCDFSLAFDHRIMDGRDAGLFLSALKKGIEHFKS